MLQEIPKFITRYELSIAYDEGQVAYAEGTLRGYNPYADLGQDELAAAWWSGWDAADAEAHS